MVQEKEFLKNHRAKFLQCRLRLFTSFTPVRQMSSKDGAVSERDKNQHVVSDCVCEKPGYVSYSHR